MSHVVLTCTCRQWNASLSIDDECPVPGHGMVPPDPVDPWALVEAGREALEHLAEVERHLIAARAAWVTRGLPCDNAFPLSIDRQTAGFVHSRHKLHRWVVAAAKVAEQRTGATA